ncbi:MAG: hypothetical protein JW955_05120 [Sedimentisphaerales bacterium]|nr:hypothetical protein [Sedimentisphaerales bacterium]
MRRIVFRVLLLLLSCTVALVLAEVLARRFLSPPQIVEVRTSSGTTPAQPTSMVFTNDPERGQGLVLTTPAGRRLRPNTVAVVENYGVRGETIEIRTNAQGYRNRDIGPKAGTRILFLGDSITFGVCLHDHELFLRRIETMAENDGLSWDVINTGVPVIGLRDYLSILSETGFSVAPDAVVLVFFLDDFKESAGVVLPRMPRLLKKSWFLYHCVAAPLQATALGLARAVGTSSRIDAALYERLDLVDWERNLRGVLPTRRGDYRQDAAAFNDLILRRFTTWGMAWSPEAWQLARPFFVELAERCAARGIKLLAVCLPARAQVEASYTYDFPQQQMRAASGELGMPYLDILGYLRSRADLPPAADLYYDECHYTPLGNRYLAEAMYPFIRSNLEVVSGATTTNGALAEAR